MRERLARLGLRLRVFLFFALLAAGTLAVLAGGMWLGYSRVGEAGVGSAFVLAGLIAGFGILGLVAWIWYLFDENVARAIQSLAGGMRARAHADISSELDHTSARYLGDLAPAAREITGALAKTRDALAEAVERETTRLAVENARLEALLADVPAGVLLCSADHQIVFYNSTAQDVLAGEVSAALDRSILDHLRPGPLQATYQRLVASEDVNAASNVLCAATQSGRVLAGRMRLVHLPRGTTRAPGYVLTLRDVTTDLALHSGREALLEEIVERVRRPAANLQTVLGSGAWEDSAGRAALLAEVETLTRAITDLAHRYDAVRGTWWPKEEIRASELADSIAAVVARDGVVVRTDVERLFLQCDAFQLIALVAHLCDRLAHEAAVINLSLSILAEDGGAMLTLDWSGEVLPVGRLDAWLAAPLEVGLANVTGRSVLAAHATDIWPEAEAGRRPRLCLPIHAARETGPAASALRRAVVYNFDLMDRELPGELAATPLRALTCVVFDTETTGLLPSSGDEIVQVAALRLVGGRRVPGETFETLVNPHRPIPIASTEVHGITDAMVADAPAIATAGRRFHAFAEGSVLVAHNAPFDLEFLRRHEADIGVRFDHPVLDTVLLSAVVFGQSQTHTLDALAERLGIVIPVEARHTAMGDAIATAAALEMMIPMLEGLGLVTFGQVLDAVRRHSRLLYDANQPEMRSARPGTPGACEGSRAGAILNCAGGSGP